MPSRAAFSLAYRRSSMGCAADEGSLRRRSSSRYWATIWSSLSNIAVEIPDQSRGNGVDVISHASRHLPNLPLRLGGEAEPEEIPKAPRVIAADDLGRT